MCSAKTDLRLKACCFASIVLHMYCYYKFSRALPHGAVGLSAVFDCGIPDQTHLHFYQSENMAFHEIWLIAP